MKVYIVLIGLFAFAGVRSDEDIHHQHIFVMERMTDVSSDNPETETNFWNSRAQASLKEQAARKLNTNIAKNVILFMGDGMSIPTLAASRIYKWQTENKKMGEGSFLSFEKFPFIGLSRTYCVDRQVADSACSATAYLGGVKGNIATIGVNGNVHMKDCKASLNASNHVDSIAKWAQEAGKSTGIVTNTRITHASPAGAYAHIAFREWESDQDIANDGADPKECDDIAKQLILNLPGKNFNVILGGGRRNFLPEDDPVLGKGRRTDGLDLIKSWHEDKINKKVSHTFIWDRKALKSLKELPEYLLGLFAESHLAYNLENKQNEPRLEEMTEAAIKVLQKNKNGYFLFVEGGKIDLAHHDNRAHLSLDETVEFSKAIQKAVSMTNESDTLIVVTSDHAHTMSFSGYPSRKESIFGFAGIGSDEKPYSILSYANGMGYKITNGERPDMSKDDRENYKYKFPAAAPLEVETHGGDDVGVFARGPYSHLFTGCYEQNYIPHAMAFASCIGRGLKACD